MPNLLAQGGFGCVYYPSIDNGRKDKKSDKEFVTKIQRKDEAAANEIRVGKLICTFKKYRLFFLPIVKSWNLTIDKRNAGEFKDCDIISNSVSKYIAMDVPFVKATDFLIELKANGPHRKVLILLESFRVLLMSVEVLHSLKVVHFDLKLGNILYLKVSQLPRILDFGISIIDPLSLAFPEGAYDIEKKLQALKTHFYAFTVEYKPWCLDIVVLSCIAEYKEWSASYAKMIAEQYEDKSRLGANRMREIISQLTKYGTMSLPALVNYLLSQWRTWDIYSIGIIYKDIFRDLMADDTSIFLKNWQRIIGKAISANPEQRLGAEDSVKQFDDLFLTWSDPAIYSKIVTEFNDHAIDMQATRRPTAAIIS